MIRNKPALIALTFSALSLAACGKKQSYAASDTSAAAIDTSAATGQVTPADTAAPKHHSVLAGALAGAAAGHVAGHHAIAGAAVGALVQHERNKHQTK